MYYASIADNTAVPPSLPLPTTATTTSIADNSHRLFLAPSPDLHCRRRTSRPQPPHQRPQPHVAVAAPRSRRRNAAPLRHRSRSSPPPVKEMSQGSFQPARQNDILSVALGTNEHGGYVRGVGVHSKIRDVFGMPCRGKSSGGVSGVDLEAMEKNLYDKLADKIRRETMEEMEQNFKDMQSQLLQSFMKNAQASPRVGTPLWSSCQSVSGNSKSSKYEEFSK